MHKIKYIELQRKPIILKYSYQNIFVTVIQMFINVLNDRI